MPPEDLFDLLKKLNKNMQTKPSTSSHFNLYGKFLFDRYQRQAKRLGLPKEVPDQIVQAVKNHVAIMPQSKLTLTSCLLALDVAIAQYNTKTF